MNDGNNLSEATFSFVCKCEFTKQLNFQEQFSNLMFVPCLWHRMMRILHMLYLPMVADVPKRRVLQMSMAFSMDTGRFSAYLPFCQSKSSMFTHIDIHWDLVSSFINQNRFCRCRRSHTSWGGQPRWLAANMFNTGSTGRQNLGISLSFS